MINEVAHRMGKYDCLSAGESSHAGALKLYGNRLKFARVTVSGGCGLVPSRAESKNVPLH